jgi:hypothetical protein
VVKSNGKLGDTAFPFAEWNRDASHRRLVVLNGAEIAGKIDLTGIRLGSELFLQEVFCINDKWNAEQADQLLRAVLADIDELGDKLSPARAEALLDDFEHEISGAFLRQDIAAVMANCEEYARRFRTLAQEED